MSAKRRKSHVMVTRLDIVSTPGRFTNQEDKENDQHSQAAANINYDLTDSSATLAVSSSPSASQTTSFSVSDPAKLEAEFLSPNKYGGIAFHTKSTVTIPKPFSFHAREMEVLRKRKMLSAEAEKRAVALANSFRARPMRVGSPDPLPQRSVRSPVRPIPFNFQVEERISQYRSRRQESFSSSDSTMQRSRVKSPSVIHRPPFIPKPSVHSPLVPHTPKLATSERAVQRLKFDEMLQRRRHSMEAKQRAIEAMQQAEEEEKLKRLRQTLVHKPQPIRRYKSVRVVERKPLTNAKSPNFSNRKDTHSLSK